MACGCSSGSGARHDLLSARRPVVQLVCGNCLELTRVGSPAGRGSLWDIRAHLAPGAASASLPRGADGLRSSWLGAVVVPPVAYHRQRCTVRVRQLPGAHARVGAPRRPGTAVGPMSPPTPRCRLSIAPTGSAKAPLAPGSEGPSACPVEASARQGPRAAPGPLVLPAHDGGPG